MDAWKDTVSGMVGATCCVYTGQPFDTVKVRLQLQHMSAATATQATSAVMYHGPIDAMRKILGQEGAFAFFKGSTPALTGAIMENSVLFTVNGRIKEAVQWYYGLDTKTKEGRDSTGGLSLLQLTMCGGLSGMFSGTALCIPDMVKVRLQAQRSAGGSGNGVKYTGPLDVVAKAFRSGGFRGLFVGWSCMIMRDVPFNASFFGSYETTRHLLAKLSTEYRGVTKTVDDLNAWELLLAGGVAGTFGWSVAFPFDVCKSRAQVQSHIYGHMWSFQILAHIVRTEGVRTLYRGVSTAMVRAFPANAALFAGYETSRRLLD
eukprot:GFYU01004847.1.p1 GENE.GFYU01004847.1~~GFYU01004847.1.p1  ORF type:complete len:317 (+),score=40.50 GFYU01004847.1:93-1043(+)